MYNEYLGGSMVAKSITHCMVNDTIMLYDYCSQDINGYNDWPNFKDFEYLGEGIIHMVNGVVQHGSKMKHHFWKNKSTLTTMKESDIEALAIEVFPLPPIEGWTPDYDVWGNDRKNWIAGYKAALSNSGGYSEEQFWLCLYQYKGMETEGHLQTMEKFICEAKDEADALFKYHIWICIREKRKDFQYKSLSDYRKTEYASGGWGYCAYKLDNANNKITQSWRDDRPWFYEKYNQFNH